MKTKTFIDTFIVVAAFVGTISLLWAFSLSSTKEPLPLPSAAYEAEPIKYDKLKRAITPYLDRAGKALENDETND